MWNTIIFRSKIVNQIISSVDEYEYIKHLKRFGSKTKTVWSSRFVSLYMRDPFNCHMEFHRSYVQMDISVNDRGKQLLLNFNFNHTLSVRCLPFSHQWHFYTRKIKKKISIICECGRVRQRENKNIFHSQNSRHSCRNRALDWYSLTSIITSNSRNPVRRSTNGRSIWPIGSSSTSYYRCWRCGRDHYGSDSHACHSCCPSGRCCSFDWCIYLGRRSWTRWPEKGWR